MAESRPVGHRGVGRGIGRLIRRQVIDEGLLNKPVGHTVGIDVIRSGFEGVPNSFHAIEANVRNLIDMFQCPLIFGILG